MIYYTLDIKKKKKQFFQGNSLDFYQTQNKYRQKQFKSVLGFCFKLLIFFLLFMFGWWFGNSDKLVLIAENEKIINDHLSKESSLERKLADTRLKLKEANLALSAQNIKDKNSDLGREAKNFLAYSLASGVSEKDIINSLKLLSNKKICDKLSIKELAVSTQTFVPPENILTLFSGSLKLKVISNTVYEVNEAPYFDPQKPIRAVFKYLGNNDIVEGKLPISKNITAGNFQLKIKISESKVRGAVMVSFKSCKI